MMSKSYKYTMRQQEYTMSSNCPYCGTTKLSKTFNFNEYACDMCESDFKVTEGNIRIFREGSWSSLCTKSLQEMSNRVSGASVIDILSRTLRAAAKQSPNDIDVVIESLTSVAATLHSEWKMGLRQVNDFTVVMEGIKVFEIAAITLKKRENELNLRIKIDESWGMGEDALDKVNADPVDIGEDPVTTVSHPAGVTYDTNTEGEIEEADTPAVPVDGNDELDKLLNEPEATDTEAPAPEADAAPIDDTAVTDDSAGESKDDLVANAVDAVETVEDKLTRLSDKVGDLKTALDALKGADAPAEEVAPETPAVAAAPVEEPSADAPEAPEAPEDSVEPPVEESRTETEILNNSFDKMGKYIFADILEAAKNGRRSKKVASSYKRKIDAVEGSKKSPTQTDMTAEENEEKIPFTEAPADEIDNKTNSTGPGAVKGTPKIKDKDMQKESRNGFNGYRVGDEVILEKSKDTWKISEIDESVFTLVRGQTATVIDTFKEDIRHADSRLEGQRNNELIGESAKRWASVEKSYTTTNESCVGGVCGLGGGNRLGGEKLGMGNMLLSPMTTINTGHIPSSKAQKSSIYKFIKDNDLHRCQREIAIPRLSEAFTNPIEEMAQILDDAILSESEGQTESIDGIYEYIGSPIGEHARKDAFKKGWQQIDENEVKPAPKKAAPLAGVGYYKTKENDILDRLGRTAAERLLGE